MALNDLIELEGVVIKICRGFYDVKISGNNQIVKCTLCGKMRTNKIFVVEGDSVKLRISPYDVTKGTIFFRQK